MSIRLEMLQVARLAPKLLADSKDLIATFLQSQESAGAFKDRSGQPDLYYTVFGLESLRALSVELPVEASSTWLGTFGSGEDLDLVHLCCLIRCWANVTRTLPVDLRQGLAERMEPLRSTSPKTLYNSFLVLGAYQDLGLQPPAAGELLESVELLRAADGAYANQPGAAQGLTSATAAAVAILRHFDQPLPPELSDWLLARHCKEGGFFAAPSAPIPDLLSTATALHALSSLHASLDPIRESTLDFVDSLWTSRGGFLGSWADETLDCEYTYYGLLSLGHLSV